jgi:molybdopterin converting factor small subunit
MISVMTINIVFYGPLERWAGKRMYSTNGITIRQVFKNLESQIGKSVLDHVINPETGSVKSHFHILLNGIDIESLNGFDQLVKDGDTITCVPPVGGGKDSTLYSRK